MVFKRLIAFIIDLFIIAVVLSPMFWATQIIKSQILLQSCSSLMITLLLCKDNINGQSIGKRVMRIQVVDINVNNKVSNVRYIIRNVFLPFWIIEFFVLFILKNKRLGDFVAKTTVINCEKAEKPQFDKNALYTILICFCMAFIFSFFLFNNLLRSPMIQLLLM